MGSKFSGWRLTLAAIVFLITIGSAHRAEAYTWVIRYGHGSCLSCHLDPSGGRLLTSYGRDEGADVLRTRWSANQDDEAISRRGRFLWGAFNTPDWLLLGGSFRPAPTWRPSSWFRPSAATWLRRQARRTGSPHSRIPGCRVPSPRCSLTRRAAGRSGSWQREPASSVPGSRSLSKRGVGAAPLEYLTRSRMQLARVLLHDGDKRIAEVAGVVGYDSESGFTTAFARLVGCRSGHYRKNGATAARHGSTEGSGRAAPPG